MGFTAAPTLIAVQSAVGWQRRGVVTGANMFFRSMGSAVGVAVFGAIANATLGHSTITGGRAPAGPLTTAVHAVFVATLVLAALMLLVVVLMPKVDRPDVSPPATPADDVAADDVTVQTPSVGRSA
jgi:hypothetical protein